MEEKNLDLLCYNFNEELVGLINKYGNALPASVVYILVRDILAQVENEKNRIIADLISQQPPAEQMMDVPVNVVTEDENVEEIEDPEIIDVE